MLALVTGANRPVRRLATATLLVGVMAALPGCSTLGIGASTPAQPTAPASSPAAPSTPSSTSSTAGSSTTPVPADPSASAPADAPAPAPAQSTGPVGFRDPYDYADGVAVTVTKIERTTALRDTRATKPAGAHSSSSSTNNNKAKRTTIPQGSPVQVLSVRVTNRGDQPLQVSPRVLMTYGPQHRSAAQVRPARPLPASVPAGGSTTATLAFSVPTKHLHEATLRLTWPAGREPAVFTGSLGYTPGNSVLFNDPTGSKADQLRITRHIERSIDGTPPGSIIRIVQYSFDITSSLEKLVAAYERGVHVQMIVDQHDQIVTKQTTRLIEVLGSDRKKKSFVIRCGASCMSNRASTMHAKYYLFSRVGSARMVSMVGSANITHTNSKGSWNDMQTFVGDATLYTSLKRYFTDMAPDANDRNYYRTTTSGPVTLYFFPRAKKHRVLLLEALDGVTCNGAAPGYGRKGKTAVQVTMYSWRVPRIDIARKLWRLHDQGCDVRIILNRSRTDLAVKQVLTRRSEKYGGMEIHDAWVDRNGNNVAERYMHQKGITISGVWQGKPNTKVVYSGSQNLAPLSTTDNNELVLRREGDAVYDAYAKNFRYAVERGTRRLY